jgi:membrane dipeptidase
LKLINRKLMLAALAASSLGLLLQITGRPGHAQSTDAALVAKAKGIHDRVLKLDTHNDIEPSNFTPDCNYTMRLTTQVNIPKMVEGDMDVSFMIAYVGQGPLTPEGYDNAYKQVIAKFDAVHRLTGKIAPGNIGLALTPADVLALHKKNLRIAVIGIENGYPIGTDIKRVKEFYGRGGIDGWNSAAEAFNVTLELVRRGYTEEQIGKMWSGNLLRVWSEVEKVAQNLQKAQG